MTHRERAQFAAERLLSLTTDASGWKLCKKTNEVVVSWRPSSEFPGNVYKGEAVVNAGLMKVWECLKPIPNGLRVKWDSNVKKFELLEQISEDVSVCRTVTPSAAMGIISPRDFVDVIEVKTYEDGTISSNATNVLHSSCPPQPGFVRGFNHPCGCVCAPLSEDKTQVFTVFQTDLSGFLPRSVVESFFPSSMTDFYCNLNRAVKNLRD